jgi:hypothetical protein
LAGTDTHLWSQTHDRKLDDIFALDKAVEYGDGGLNEIVTETCSIDPRRPALAAFLRKEKRRSGSQRSNSR